MTSKRYQEAIDKARSRRGAVRELAGQVKKFGMPEMEKHIDPELMPEVRARLDLPVEQPLPRRVTDTLGRLLAVAPRRVGLNPEKELADIMRGNGQLELGGAIGEEDGNQVVLRKMMTRYGGK
jgi:hypothetical protein